MWSHNNERANQLIDEVLANQQPDTEHFITKVQLWKAQIDHGGDHLALERRIVEILNQGGARVNLASIWVNHISSMAEWRQDYLAANAYREALAAACPNPARVLWARDMQKITESRHPEIKNKPLPSTALNLVFAEENALIEKDRQERAGRIDLRGPQRFPAWREPLYRMSDLERKYAAVE